MQSLAENIIAFNKETEIKKFVTSNNSKFWTLPTAGINKLRGSSAVSGTDL
jgi:hypothetical protein